MKNDLNGLLTWALQFDETAKIKDNYVITEDDHFNCSDRNLTELPDNIDKIKVHYFNCSFNKITKLPDSTCNMKANHFNCYNNQLTKLPDSIGDMKVDNFDCSYNKISKLPDSIGNMKVNGFYCWHNNLTKLPNSIGNMKVDDFNCADNKISKLPDSIGNMKVDYFNCSNNKIAKLPDSIINMKVERFHCSYNLLEKNHIKPNKLIEGIFEEESYCYLDEILSHIINIKIRDNVKIIKTLNSYIVSDGINHAHGKDIKSAYLDYRFKTSTKDLEQYKSININELHNLDYLYQVYRNITGSCQLGMSNWIIHNNDFIEKTEKSGSSIKDLLKITKNNFGNDKLIKFFNL